MNQVVALFTMKWLSGKASQYGIRISEVGFLVGTQNFSLSHACDKTKNILLLFPHRAKIHLLSYAIYLELVGGRSLTGSRKQLFVSGMLFEEQNLKAHRLVWPLTLVFTVRLYKQSSVVTNQLLFVMEFQQN